MIRFELKKIFSKPVNKFAFVLLAVSLCVVSYFAVGYASYVDGNGEKSTGIAAAKALREQKEQWTGYITEEVLQRVLEENTRINHSKEYLSTDVKEQDKAYSQKQGFSDIREMINRAFCEFQEYNYYRADSIRPEEIPSFYQRRTASLSAWLNSDEQENRFSQQKRDFLLTQYAELETPFYYEDADGWQALLEYAPSIMMLMVLITAFPLSGIYSDEFQLKADSIFFSARYGRNKAVTAKIKAGFLLITSIYWIVIAVYSGIVLAIVGTGGANCAIQSGFANWKSFYNITYLQDYLLTVSGGYLGSLFILFLSMFVSAKARSKALAVTVPFLLLFLPSFLSEVSLLSDVLGLLPDQLLQLCTTIKTFYLYQIGTKVVGAVPILLTLYLVLFCILLPVLYRVYRKMEIK